MFYIGPGRFAQPDRVFLLSLFHLQNRLLFSSAPPEIPQRRGFRRFFTRTAPISKPTGRNSANFKSPKPPALRADVTAWAHKSARAFSCSSSPRGLRPKAWPEIGPNPLQIPRWGRDSALPARRAHSASQAAAKGDSSAAGDGVLRQENPEVFRRAGHQMLAHHLAALKQTVHSHLIAEL